MGGSEEGVEDVGDAGGIRGRQLLGVDEVDEGAGGAELGAVVAELEVVVEDLDGLVDGEAEGVGGFAPEFLVAAIELCDEEGVFGLPVVEGFGVDLEAVADGVLGFAREERVEGIELAVGEAIFAAGNLGGLRRLGIWFFVILKKPGIIGNCRRGGRGYGFGGNDRGCRSLGRDFGLLDHVLTSLLKVDRGYQTYT